METKESLTYEMSLDRYLKGECPLCGRRMEKRKRQGDYFCHKCKRAWTGEDVLSLKQRLPIIFSISKEAPPQKSSSFFQRLRKNWLG